MAASDYVNVGLGSFCPMGLLGSNISPLAEVITISNFKPVTGSDLEVGMALMIGNEVCRLQSTTLPNLTILRGCADTVPAPHAADTRVWFFSEAGASDEREYLATDQIGIKLSPYTMGSGPVPIESTPPLAVTFNWRFARPYAPGKVQVGGEPWFTRTFAPQALETEFVITWAHRDRVTQADQLIGHTADSIGPEAGVTYTARIYDADDVLVRTIDGITGTSLSYTYSLAEVDIPTGVGRLVLSSVRDDLESWQSYTVLLRGVAGGGGLGESLGENLGG